MLRALLTDLLQRHGFEVLAAASGQEALASFRDFDPDALLTDVDLGQAPDGAQLATVITAVCPHVGVVFLTNYPRAAAGARAFGIPHAAFIDKTTLVDTDEVVAALETVLSSRAPVDAPVPDAADRDLEGLTRHQLADLRMLAHGWSNEQIAAQSDRSVRAVERSVSRIFERLGVTGDPSVSPRVAAAAQYLAVFGPAR